MKNIKMKYLSLIIGGCLLLAINSSAQQKDSVEIMQKFVHICNAYKQTPLYLNLQYTVSSNFISTAEDSSSAEVEFYITKDNSYIKFGELEQMVNDSMALLISEKMQRMILYRNAAPIITQMKAMMGMQMPDSSIKNLCKKYRINPHGLSGRISSIILENRNLLYNTALSKETIELQYDEKTKFPKSIIALQRNLILIQKSDYDKLLLQKDFENKLFRIEEKYYVVKEKISDYSYKKIIHQPTLKVPVRFEERINKNNEGKYLPAKNYESYVLSEE